LTEFNKIFAFLKSEKFKHGRMRENDEKIMLAQTTRDRRMMHIQIERIKDQGLALELVSKPESFPVLAAMTQSRECEFHAPIRTSLKAIRIGDMVEVEGTIETFVLLTCGRCLIDFEIPLKTPFSLTYVQETPRINRNSERDNVELGVEDVGLIYFQGEEIDLQDGIQEYVVMMLPLRALCSETCKGLCQKCGADLNAGDCGCDRRVVNNKFSVLKNLKLEQK
jgi:uncharacterized protein